MEIFGELMLATKKKKMTLKPEMQSMKEHMIIQD